MRALPPQLLRSISELPRQVLGPLLVGALCSTSACSGCRRSHDNTPARPPASTSPHASVSTALSDEHGSPVYEEGAAPPQVRLAGGKATRDLPTLPGSKGTIGAVGWEVPIHKAPDPASPVLGHLRAGAVVSASEQPVGSKDCKGGWYAIAPFGFVCASPRTATTNLDDEVLRAIPRGPDLDEPLPYMYGIARHPGPIYARLPTHDEAAAAEPGLDKRIAAWLALDDHNGASFRADYWLRWHHAPTPPPPAQLWEQRITIDVPPYLLGGRMPPGNLSGLIQDKSQLVVAQMKRHNGFAFLDTAVFEGRRYVVSTDLLVLPVDRLRPIEGSSFHGYQIPTDIDFPFAIVRARNAYARAMEKGKLVKKAKLKRREAIKLTGKQNFFGGVLHFETVDGLWLPDREVSRVDPARRMPAWGKNGERWIDVNITKQVLVAYEGTKAVFATLVSTGEAGLGDPETTKSTKRGIFRIDRKYITTTMDSDIVGEEFELRDIPYVQYFEGGYALHAAYWHDDFGTPRSHGCINLSPEDARRLFFWTEPKLPPGWHSVRRPLTGSVVFVHP